MIVAQLVVADCIETPRVGVKLKQGEEIYIYIDHLERNSNSLSLWTEWERDEEKRGSGVCVVRRRETVRVGRRRSKSPCASASASSFSSHS